MSSKTETEIQQIASNYKSYNPDALLALIQESEIRNMELVEIENIRMYLENVQANKEEKKEQFIIPINLPFSIKLASDLTYALIPFGFINLIIFDRLGIIPADTKQVTTGIISWLFAAALGYWIRTGSNSSRTVTTIFTAIALVFMIPAIFYVFQFSIFAGIMSLLINALSVVVVVLLFKKESSAWYKERKIK